MQLSTEAKEREGRDGELRPLCREIVAGEFCPLCGSEGVPVRTEQEVILRHCACVSPGGVLLAWNYESERAYESLYSVPCKYHVETQAEEGQPTSYHREAEHLAAARSRMNTLCGLFGPFPKSLPLMDIGSGLGGFIQGARERGLEAYGLEPSADARQWAEARQRPTRAGSWRDLAPGWQMITLHDVFEHLTRPVACLEHLGSCLEPGGLLLIEMPEWDSPHQRECGWDWRHIRPKQHVCLYSRTSAEALFARAGFGVEAFWRPVRGRVGKATWALSKRACGHSQGANFETTVIHSTASVSRL